MAEGRLVRWFSDLGSADVPDVGGKSASLGEMYNQLGGRGVPIPNGFSTTVLTYENFLTSPVPGLRLASFDALSEGLRDGIEKADTLADALKVLFEPGTLSGESDLHDRAEAARDLLTSTEVPDRIREAIEEGYQLLCEEYGREVDTAVRSSATREDSAIASFAGQYESYLNIRGADDVVHSWRRCIASGFTERALGYQLSHGMDPLEGAVAVTIMKMVRADLATSGVMFTMDPDSGNRNVIVVTSSYGLGELVVQGAVSPDSFVVWKEGMRRGTNALVHSRMGAKDRKMVYSRQGGTATESVDVESSLRRRWSLTSDEVLELARMGLVVEEHYGRPMDVEWAKDGQTGKLFIVQARPETVHGIEGRNEELETFRFPAGVVDRLREDGGLLLKGVAVGTRIGHGKVRRYDNYEEVITKKRRLRDLQKRGVLLDDIPVDEHVFDPGDVLVTEMTTPDWEPLMKEAGLIITERGGLHANRVGRPLSGSVFGTAEVREPAHAGNDA